MEEKVIGNTLPVMVALMVFAVVAGKIRNVIN